MMNFSTTLRDRRHFFGPTHYSIANYCTEPKNDMKPTFGDEYFLNNLHDLIPNPLKRNLADMIITENTLPPNNEMEVDVKTNEMNQNHTDNSRLAGITNFLSGVFNAISGAMFSKRKQTDYSSETDGEMALDCTWHGAKSGDENKILQDENCPIGVSDANPVPEMGDCRAAAAHCQNKLEQVRLLLSKPVPCTARTKRRPKKVFIEPSSVEDCFEDAFAPEDFETLPNESYLEYVTPCSYNNNNFQEISAPKIRTERCPVFESTDIVKNVPDTAVVPENQTPIVVCDKKEELVASCEDKLSKLKALLQERKKKIIEPTPQVTAVEEPPKLKTTAKVKDKHYKNANRCTDKRRKSKMRQNIHDDMLFANEMNTDDLSSVENSPSTKTHPDFTLKPSNLEYFDEITGRFHTSCTDSDDSFQIVFNDSPRLRRPSDCESEDSFIVFDDSQDSCYVSNNCYTSNDVFGDSSDSESCDSDSDLSDSGCDNMTFRLSHSLSKSVSNLTDDSLYNNSEDEVDGTVMTVCENVMDHEFDSGLLIDTKKKETRKCLTPKKVQFSTQPPKVHVMRVWAFAARQARAGHWERFALDRARFKRRIDDVDVAVSWVLKPQHRSRVMFQRFMPWWNAQRRRELAEKKQKEEEELRREQEKQTQKEKLEQDNETSVLQEEVKDDRLETTKVETTGVQTEVERVKENQVENLKIQETEELGNVNLERSNNMDMPVAKCATQLKALVIKEIIPDTLNTDILSNCSVTSCVQGSLTAELGKHAPHSIDLNDSTINVTKGEIENVASPLENRVHNINEEIEGKCKVEDNTYARESCGDHETVPRNGENSVDLEKVNDRNENELKCTVVNNNYSDIEKKSEEFEKETVNKNITQQLENPKPLQTGKHVNKHTNKANKHTNKANKQKSHLESRTKKDSTKNQVNITNNHNNIKNPLRIENDRPTNDKVNDRSGNDSCNDFTNQIVQYNDKILNYNNDFIEHAVKNT